MPFGKHIVAGIALSHRDEVRWRDLAMRGMGPPKKSFEAGQPSPAINQRLKIEPYLSKRESVMQIAFDLLNHHFAPCNLG